MSQTFLMTQSIVYLTHTHNNTPLHLCNQSFLRTHILLEEPPLSNFSNSLFCIETEVSSQQNTPIQFEQAVRLRNIVSNRYLSYQTDYQQQDTDGSLKMCLSTQPCLFRIVPCFHYQTKISNKAKLGEDLYLGIQLSSGKMAYLSVKDKGDGRLGVCLRASFRVKMVFHHYHSSQREETWYTFGQSVWIKHIQSNSYLVHKGQIQNQKGACLQSAKEHKRIQGINGLWVIQSPQIIKGGLLNYGDHFRLKNMANNSYLSIFQVGKDQEPVFRFEYQPMQNSNFFLEPLKGSESKVNKGDYLILRHVETSLYLGAGSSRARVPGEGLSLLGTTQFQDEHLFEVSELKPEQQQTIRFMLGLGQQLRMLQTYLDGRNSIEKSVLDGILSLYQNTVQQLSRLQASDEKLLSQVQMQLGQYIPVFCRQLEAIRQIKDSTSLSSLRRQIYSILKLLCSGTDTNQNITHEHLILIVTDIFKGVGAQELIGSIFKNNLILLCRLPQPVAVRQTLIRLIINTVIERRLPKDTQYWEKAHKLFELFEVFIYYHGNPIDINQRVISAQLLAERCFDRIFTGIAVNGQRMQVYHDETKRWVDLDRVKEVGLLQVSEGALRLFANLCQHRNFLAKQYVDGYLTGGNRQGIEVMLQYFNIPTMPPSLLSRLVALTMNCYVDSAPRIDRKMPLPFILVQGQSMVNSSVQQGPQASGRMLRQSLLNRQSQYLRQTTPLEVSHIDNELNIQQIEEPSLNERLLQIYKEQLRELMQAGQLSTELLDAIRTLISLQSYALWEMAKIKNTIEGSLTQIIDQNLLNGTLQILEKLEDKRREMELLAITNYIQYKLSQQSTSLFTQDQIKYCFPDGPNISAPLSQGGPIAEPTHVRHQREGYNNIRKDLQKLKPSAVLAQNMLNLWLKQETVWDSKCILKLSKAFLSICSRAQSWCGLLSGVIVISNQEILIWKQVFSAYKVIKHYGYLSQKWLTDKNSHTKECFLYVAIIREITCFLHQGHSFNPHYQANFSKNNLFLLPPMESIDINRQLYIRNLGLLQVLLQLLSQNFYILSQNDPSPEQILVFSTTFTFMLRYCYRCPENINHLIKHISILQKYLKLTQVGQNPLLRLLYRSQDSLTKQVSSELVNSIVIRIGRNGQYNPQHLKMLLAIATLNNGKAYKPNLYLIYKAIQSPHTLQRLLFLDKKGQLCLDLSTTSQNPQRVPVIYHTYLFQLLTILLKYLESYGAELKQRLEQIINVPFLVECLTLPDIYSTDSLIGEIYFIFKQRVYSLLTLYFDRQEALRALFSSKQLPILLQQLADIYILHKKVPTQARSLSTVLKESLKEQRNNLDYFRLNQRQYYLTHVKPILLRLDGIIGRNVSSEGSPLPTLIRTLLQQINPYDLAQDHIHVKAEFGISHIRLKWRNFADMDLDNSIEERQGKATVVELLRHIETQKIVESQRNQLFRMLQKREEDFLRGVMVLLKTLSDCNLSQNQSLSGVCDILRLLADYLQFLGKKTKSVTQNGEKLSLMSIHCISTVSFSYHHPTCQHIFVHVIRILIQLLSIPELFHSLVKCLHQNLSRSSQYLNFFSCLQEAISQISLRIESNLYYDQINSALDQLTLTGQPTVYETDKLVLKLIGIFCRYVPFEQLLRSQPYHRSVDLLDKMYNCLYCILRGEKGDLRVTIASISITQLIIDSMGAFCSGCQHQHQNFIIDSKIPDLAVQVLQMPTLNTQMDHAYLNRRQNLLQQVVSFYEGNGIEVEGKLRSEMRVLDFSHPYLLNRLKLSLLWLLLQATLGNTRAIDRLKMHISGELLRVNLMWIFEEWKEAGGGQGHLTEQLVLKGRQGWDTVVDSSQLSPTFLMVGYYLYQLIQQQESTFNLPKGNSEISIEDEDDGLDTGMDQQKHKQKLTRKFFTAISQSKARQTPLNAFQGLQSSQEMTSLYQSYFQAYQFFTESSCSIEAVVHGQLARIYFPKLPLCNSITEREKLNLIEGAERINHDEKIKSLMEWERKQYEWYQGRVDYQRQMWGGGKWLGVGIDEEDVFLGMWLISCLIVLFYLIADFKQPNKEFKSSIFSWITPQNVFNTVLLILTVLLGLLALILIANLILQKLPFLHRLYSARYSCLSSTQQSQALYLIAQMTPLFLFDCYMIIFSILTLLHPLFAGFILIYIVQRIAIGRQIARAIQQTWNNLLVATALLVIFNYMFAIIIFSASFTQDIGYGTPCKTLFRCLLLELDMSLKEGSGFLGNVDASFTNMTLNMKFILQITYILFAQMVIFEIFSGTIIDKFSQLRERSSATAEDEASMCYICDQERFQIDFELEGYEDHVQCTHNKFYYAYYIFLLRRKVERKGTLGWQERHIWERHQTGDYRWIPEGVSLLKEAKSQGEGEQQEKSAAERLEQFYRGKLSELKKMKGRVETMGVYVRDEQFVPA